MSYYYGIVFTWSYYYGLAKTSSDSYDDKDSIKNVMISIGEIPKLDNKPDAGSDPIGWYTPYVQDVSPYNSNITYVRFPDDIQYNIPAGSHVDNIINQMVKISYINCTISDGKIM